MIKVCRGNKHLDELDFSSFLGLSLAYFTEVVYANNEPDQKFEAQHFSKSTKYKKAKLTLCQT